VGAVEETAERVRIVESNRLGERGGRQVHVQEQPQPGQSGNLEDPFRRRPGRIRERLANVVCLEIRPLRQHCSVLIPDAR
jgi:hypothetical protein